MVSPSARRVTPPPEAWYPAGWSGVTARHLELPGGERTRVVEGGPPAPEARQNGRPLGGPLALRLRYCVS